MAVCHVFVFEETIYVTISAENLSQYLYISRNFHFSSFNYTCGDAVKRGFNYIKKEITLFFNFI